MMQSKAIKIQPLPGIVFIQTEKVIVAGLATDQVPSAVEYAKVIAVGEDVKSVKVGDNVFVKSWAIDSIYHNDTWFRFVAIETNGILAVIK